MRNVELARVFRDIAAYLDMDEVPFKPRAYEKAAQAIESHDRPLDAVYRAGGVKALREIPGIGTSMAEKLEELITTGKCKLREEYHRRMPVDLAALTALEGVGPKAVKVLYQRLGVRTLADLEAAARAGKVRALPHFGEKSEQKILKALAFVQTSGQRTPLAAVRPVIDELAAALARVPGVARVEVAGSIRRRKETVGDADLLALARTTERAIAAFAKLAPVARVLGQGDTKCSVKLQDGLQVDLRVVPEESFGAALLYFTGSKAHNVALRQLAMKKGWKLNEYGLFRGTRRIAGRTEQEIFDRLNAKLDGIRILAGAEVNINRDGTLDIDDETLAQLDVVGIAVHSHFNLPRREQTDRIVRAMRNPHADILFHPTGRVIARREPYDVDIEAVIAAAKETGTVLELDAYPDRLDLRDEHVRRATEAGVPIVIDSDAHSVKHLGFPRAYGVDQARRGWATAKDVLNTRPVEGFLAGLKGGAPRRRAARQGSRHAP